MTTPAEAFARALGTAPGETAPEPAPTTPPPRSCGALLVAGPVLLLAGALPSPVRGVLRQYGWAALAVGALQDRPPPRGALPALGPAVDLLLTDVAAARLVSAVATTPYALRGVRLLRGATAPGAPAGTGSSRGSAAR